MPDRVDDEFVQRVIQQALQLWIEPEITKRQASGRAASPFRLTAAQVLFDPDSEVAEVRLNEEVKAAGEMSAEGPLEKGQLITIDPQKITRVLLTDADPNAGHITILAFGPRWLLSFDLRRNATRIREHIEAAEEFIDAASTAQAKGQMRAFAENLFAGVELLARALLLALPGREIIESKKHSTTTRRFNWWAGKLGNADPRFAELLNDLEAMRHSGRYLKREFSVAPEVAKAMIETANEMLRFAQATAPEIRPVE